VFRVGNDSSVRNRSLRILKSRFAPDQIRRDVCHDEIKWTHESIWPFNDTFDVIQQHSRLLFMFRDTVAVQSDSGMPITNARDK